MMKSVLMLCFLVLVFLPAYSQKEVAYFKLGTLDIADTMMFDEVMAAEFVSIEGVTGCTVTGGSITVDGISKSGRIEKGGTIGLDSTAILKLSKGKKVTFIVEFTNAKGVKMKSGFVFVVM